MLIRISLVLALVGFQGPLAAQVPVIDDWPEWNRISPPVVPDSAWSRYASPEEAGWSAEKLEAVGEFVKDSESPSVLVIYNGAILAEWGESRRRFMCHSMRKSLLSGIYGIAVDDGLIDLRETIGALGIDDISRLTETEKTATVGDLLKARSGVYHPAAYWPPPEDAPERGSRQPGNHWFYNNWDSNALGTIYNQKTAGDLFRSFEAKIARPIGMQDFDLRHTYYHLEAQNSRHPAYPFRMSSRDLARFGLLFLDEGRWNQRQVLPADWVWESTRAYSTHYSGGYGYMWWTARENSLLGQLGAYWAAGYGGHYLYVVPGARLVLVHRADTYTGNHVNDIYPTNILNKILAARIGPPRAAPRLMRDDEPEPDDAGIRLAAEKIGAVIGEYHGDDSIVTLREIEGQLEISSPVYGRFLLHPRSPGRFVMEDSRFPVEMLSGSDSRVVTIRVEVPSDKVYSFHRHRNYARER